MDLRIEGVRVELCEFMRLLQVVAVEFDDEGLFNVLTHHTGLMTHNQT